MTKQLPPSLSKLFCGHMPVSTDHNFRFCTGTRNLKTHKKHDQMFCVAIFSTYTEDITVSNEVAKSYDLIMMISEHLSPHWYPNYTSGWLCWQATKPNTPLYQRRLISFCIPAKQQHGKENKTERLYQQWERPSYAFPSSVTVSMENSAVTSSGLGIVNSSSSVVTCRPSSEAVISASNFCT